MTTYNTNNTTACDPNPNIPVMHIEEKNNNGLLLGAAVLALGALAVAGGAALMGDDDYDTVASYDEPVVAAAVSDDLDDREDYATYDYDTYVSDADLNDDINDMDDMDDAMMLDDDIDAALNDESDYADATIYADDEQDTIEYRTTYEAEAKTAVLGATAMHPAKINDTVGEVLQADGEPSIQSDEEIIVMDDTVRENAFRAADDDGMVADNAIVVPGSNGTLTTVTCPAGTTAQTDMTCKIDGDYTPNLDN
jgi:hypothetical protein